MNRGRPSSASVANEQDPDDEEPDQWMEVADDGGSRRATAGTAPRSGLRTQDPVVRAMVASFMWSLLIQD